MPAKYGDLVVNTIGQRNNASRPVTNKDEIRDGKVNNSSDNIVNVVDIKFSKRTKEVSNEMDKGVFGRSDKRISEQPENLSINSKNKCVNTQDDSLEVYLTKEVEINVKG
ncbi:hypothetical protein Tco_0530728 [Tanacetum coccineum]